ncbi:hypothetical protein [Pseudalkalibacillus hwajinpoensis]|uniref:hypothetical protein n=1 Tax=Guptibacillus hwajinpoensis TaxID=208199 RepID=UPI001CD75A4D|nr:hypothetical protein [Pseudalkalibacillus hwajinpoensis]MCA0990016.1 hypothetical protein [Pseudalkalibacillus hwajinpoensis]
MSHRMFTEKELKQLQNNLNVLRLLGLTISCQSSFKQVAIKEYQKGKFPSQIFEEHGFYVNFIGQDHPNSRYNGGVKPVRSMEKQD